MPVCEFYESCPIFNKSMTGMIERIYAVVFCKGARMKECERRKRKQEGENVPRTLLPTGAHMMSLAEK